jgi:hypothetical protein
MLKEIVKNDSNILLITPLLPGDKIHRDTKIGLKRNNTKFNWYSYTGNNNVAKNYELGIKEWIRQTGREPRHTMIIDKDMRPNRHLIDLLNAALNRTDDNIAYAYPNFSFRGSTNIDFVNRPFDPMMLMRSNYITSNSMIKWHILKEVGIVTDNKYKRLLDWALWLRMLSLGYHGVLVPQAYFWDEMNKNSVSAGDGQEYIHIYNAVKKDFIDPMLKLE